MKRAIIVVLILILFLLLNTVIFDELITIPYVIFMASVTEAVIIHTFI